MGYNYFFAKFVVGIIYTNETHCSILYRRLPENEHRAQFMVTDNNQISSNISGAEIVFLPRFS